MQHKEEGFRLSSQQKRVWLLQRDSLAYRSQSALLIEGRLVPGALRKALQEVIDRYEILRTTFHRQPGLRFPFQVIAEHGSLAWQQVDVSECGAQEQLSRIDEIFKQEGCRDFDFDKGPLLHTYLIRLSEDVHALVISLPALCADTRAVRNLMREIGRCYSARPQDERRADEPLQYVDFSEWTNDLLEGEDAEKGKEYWRNQNFSAQAALTFPIEAGTSQNSNFNSDYFALTLNADMASRIDSIARKYETSAAVILLACWQALLWRITARSDMVVGYICDGRKDEELSEAIGLLAKSLPVRCRFDESSRFSDVLKETETAIRDAYEWQEYFTWEPGSGSARNHGEADFFATAFEYDEQLSELWADKFKSYVYKQYGCIDRFKIKLFCARRDDSLTAEFHYDAESIHRDSISCLAGQFVTLLESAINEPEAAINGLEILSSSERQRLLIEFNHTQKPYPVDLCIHSIFERQVERTPHEIALVFEDEGLSYSELNARANRVAHHLISSGVGPDVPVALFVDRSLEMVVGMLGIMKAGGAYVPLDPTQPKERLGHMLEDIRSPLILSQAGLLDLLPEQDARVICLDREWPSIAQHSPDNTDGGATGENLVYVIFTSGSTGRPKGVAIEHRQLVNYVNAVQERLAFPPGANFATVSTFAADLGNTMVFPSLCMGGCLHLISQERASDPVGLADYFDRYKIDCLKIVPSHLEALLSMHNPEQLLPRRRLVMGGEASGWGMVESLMKIAPDLEIHNHYGPTETTVGVITCRVEDIKTAEQTATVPLGRPIANTEIYILDGNRQPVPIGAPGELHIGGAGLARGYLGHPELTAEKFIPNPFGEKSGTRLYKSGDLARYRPDGNIEFLGRVDNQIKFHGFRVELGEIRGALNRHPKVRDSVIVLAKDSNRYDTIVAYYVSRQEIESAELREFLLQSIIEDTIPNLFVHLKKLPLTLNGKINYQALPTIAEAKQRLSRNFIAPRTPTEKQVSEIWANTLGIERVGIRDNFFDLGGHSLLATRIITQLREAFLVELPLRVLFETPTVEGLAAALTQMQIGQENEEEMARMIEELKALSPDMMSTILSEEV